MFNYRLHDDLSFCRIDGHTIFLDTDKDRYFHLSPHMEHAFVGHIEGTHNSPEDLAPLIQRGILTTSAPSTDLPRHETKIASRSALESASPDATCGMRTVAEVLATVCWTQLRLKVHKLKKILDEATSYRDRRSARGYAGGEKLILRDAQMFLAARKLVPIEMCCLLDSLSIIRFLAKRHVHASIVFGVTNNPFSAHCWAQADDIILNDAIGNTRAYTVIRVL